LRLIRLGQTRRFEDSGGELKVQLRAVSKGRLCTQETRVILLNCA